MCVCVFVYEGAFVAYSTFDWHELRATHNSRARALACKYVSVLFAAAAVFERQLCDVITPIV